MVHNRFTNPNQHRILVHKLKVFACSHAQKQKHENLTKRVHKYRDNIKFSQNIPEQGCRLEIHEIVDRKFYILPVILYQWQCWCVHNEQTAINYTMKAYHYLIVN